MNQKVKKMWISALRSGKYKQGKKKLCHGGPQGSRYCCLGVLSDLAVKNKVCSRRVAFRENRLLNEEVKIWAGVTKQDPCDLSIENDDNNKNFKEIAQIIEEKL